MENNKKVLCFTPSFHRSIMLRGCLHDVANQSYGNIYHVVNVTYKNKIELVNYDKLYDDILSARNNIHISFNENQHNHINYMNAIKSVPDYLDYDIYVKIDDDDIHKKDYVSTIVNFFQKNDPDIVSSRVKYQLNGNLMIVNEGGWGSLGGNPDGSNFKMPMTFAFNKKALQVLLAIENPNKLSGKLWRARWHDAKLKHMQIDNKENVIWHIHGANITTANFLKKQ